MCGGGGGGVVIGGCSEVCVGNSPNLRASDGFA